MYTQTLCFYVYVFVEIQIALEETIAFKMFYIYGKSCTVDHRPRNGKHFAARAKSWNKLPRVIINKTNSYFSCFFIHFVKSRRILSK